MSDPDGALSSITRGASIHVLGTGMSRVLGLVANVLLTRALGPGLYGIYSYALLILNIIAIFTTLGSDQSVLRYIPDYNDRRKQNIVLSLAYASTVLMSSFLFVILYVSAPLISAYTLDITLFVEVLRITAVALPFISLVNVIEAVLKSVDLIEYSTLLSSILSPLFRLSAIIVAIILGYSLYGIMAAVVAATLITLISAIILLIKKTQFGIEVKVPTNEIVKYYSFSLPLTLNQAGNFLYNRVDILMVGIFLAGSSVGIYKISVTVAGFLSISIIAFNQLFPPIASKLYHDGRYDDLAVVYHRVTKWIFVTSLFPGLVMLVYPSEILSIFGGEFTRGELILQIFVIGQLIKCTAGPCGYLLMMTDHQYINMTNQLLFGIANVGLNYLLLSEIGLIGAAIATTTVLALANISQVVEIWYLEDMQPYNNSFLSSLTAIIAATGVMIIIGEFISGLVGLIIGSFTGGCIFATLVYKYVSAPQDIVMIRNLINSEYEDI
jgi:O-antigen/teichoic acid export membrane protein